MTWDARKLTVAIDRSAAEAYEFLSQPENFARWASWAADAAAVRFSERNAYGVLDYAASSGYVPLRVVAAGAGCELVLTLFRRPGLSEETFAADAERVLRDLEAAKRLLEEAP